MLSLFVSAFLLGLVFNAAPGAVFAETLRQGVQGGFRPALFVQLGSLVGDALWAVLGLLGVGMLLQSASLRLPVSLAGVAYLLWLSYDAWRASALVGREAINDSEAKKNALRAGVLLSVTNPHNLAYWSAIGSALAGLGIAEPDLDAYAVFFFGFMASSMAWAFVCAGLVARVFRGTSSAWTKLTYRACAAAFLLLAISSFRELWMSFGHRTFSGLMWQSTLMM